MVPADSGRISRVPPYSGAASALHPDLRVRGFTLCGRRFHAVPLVRAVAFVGGPTTPAPALRRGRFGLVRFRSPLLAQSLLLSLLRVLRCFSSPGSPRHTPGGRRLGRPGCPIRKSASRKGYLPLGAAYRSLSRPSSPPRAKASFMCPSLLSLCFLPGAAAECVRAAPPLRQEPVSGRAASCKVSLALVRSRDSLSFR